MTETRKWSALAAVLVVAIMAAGWFLLVAPKRSEAADLKTQTAAQETTNVSLQQKLQQLQVQQKDLPQQRALLAKIETNIPDNPALPSMIRDLTAAARKVGVDITSMAPAVPVAVAAAPGAIVAVPPAEAPADGSTPATDAPVVATPAAPAAALYQVPLALTVTGSYFELEQFVNKLEALKRSFLVTGFTITPSGAVATDSSSADDLQILINGRVFLSQDAAAVAAAPVTPVAAPAASE